MKSRILLAACVLALGTLCEAKSKGPLFSSPAFNPAQVERIDVFVVDLQHDAKNNSECVGGARFGASTELLQRGYNKAEHKKTQMYVDPIGLTEEMLMNPSKDWLQDLASRKYFEKSKEMPPPGQWIMVVTIDELGSRNNSIKGPGRASLSMYLFDRDQGSLLWHDSDSGKMWGGVMGNLLQKGEMKSDECRMLTSVMIHKMPKHKK